MRYPCMKVATEDCNESNWTTPPSEASTMPSAMTLRSLRQATFTRTRGRLLRAVSSAHIRNASTLFGKPEQARLYSTASLEMMNMRTEAGRSLTEVTQQAEEEGLITQGVTEITRERERLAREEAFKQMQEAAKSGKHARESPYRPQKRSQCVFLTSPIPFQGKAAPTRIERFLRPLWHIPGWRQAESKRFCARRRTRKTQLRRHNQAGLFRLGCGVDDANAVIHRTHELEVSERACLRVHTCAEDLKRRCACNCVDDFCAQVEASETVDARMNCTVTRRKPERQREQRIAGRSTELLRTGFVVVVLNCEVILSAQTVERLDDCVVFCNRFRFFFSSRRSLFGMLLEKLCCALVQPAWCTSDLTFC